MIYYVFGTTQLSLIKVR